MQHAVQIARDPKTSGQKFLSEYLNEYLINRANHGMKAEDAYKCIKAEIEAHAFQFAIEKLFEKEGIQAKFEKVSQIYADANALSLIKDNADAKELAKLFKAEYDKQKTDLVVACAKLQNPKGK